MGRKHLYPPSVRHGIPRLGKLPRGWTKTTFGEQLHLVERPVEIRPDATYQLVTAKRNRGGIVAREVLRGDQILTVGQFRVKAGDFITSNRQIIHGACGIVPHELDGAIVSGEYTVLRARTGLHLPFFAHFTHTDYFQKTCFFASVGVAVEKMIFDIEAWMELPVALPPDAEQRRIAQILSDIDAAICSSHRTSTQWRAVRDKTTSALLKNSRILPTPLEDVANSIQGGKSPKCEDRPAVPGECGVLKISAISPDGFVPSENKVISDISEFSEHMRVSPGDFLITRANTADLVGMTCVAKDVGPVPLYLCDKTLRITFHPKRVVPRFINALLKTPSARTQLIKAATGSSGSMKNISQDDIRSLRVLIPPLATQREIVETYEKNSGAIAAEERKLAALQRVKAELARRLLTGELRVKP